MDILIGITFGSFFMRLKLILLFVFFYCGVIYSQLNELSLLVKNTDQTRFSYIEEYAKNKWNDDAGAMEFEINKQSEGYVLVLKLLNEHWECQEHKTLIALEINKNSTDHDDFSDANWWRIYQEIKNRMN